MTHTMDKREQRWWAFVRVEGNDSCSVPIRAYVNLTVPFCECLPCLSHSYRLSTLHFEGKDFSVIHTSYTAAFDMRRLLKFREKMNSSFHIKICVLKQHEKLEFRIRLNSFLDEIFRCGLITFSSLNVREEETVIQLIVSQYDRVSRVLSLDKESELEGNDETQTNAIITDRTLGRHEDKEENMDTCQEVSKENYDLSLKDNNMILQEYEEQVTDIPADTGREDKNIQSLMESSLEDENVSSFSHDSMEVKSAFDEGNKTERTYESVSQCVQVVSQEIYPHSKDVETTWEEVQALWEELEPMWRHYRAIHEAVQTGNAADNELKSNWEEFRSLWEEINLIRDLVENIRDEARPICEEVQPNCERVLQLWEELEQTRHENGEKTPYTDQEQPASGDIHLIEAERVFEKDNASEITKEYLSEYAKVVSEEVYPLSQDVQTTWEEVYSVWKEMEPVWRQAEAIRQAAHTGDVIDEEFMRDWEEIKPVWEELALIRELVGEIREEARPVCEEVMPTCERILQLWEEQQQIRHEDGESPCTGEHHPVSYSSSSNNDIYLIEGDFSPSQSVELFLVTPNGDPKRVRFCSREEIDAAGGRFIDYYENVHLVLQEVREYSGEEDETT